MHWIALGRLHRAVRNGEAAARTPRAARDQRRHLPGDSARLGAARIARNQRSRQARTVRAGDQNVEGRLMSIAQSMLAEFDQEMAGTRKTLERVPDDNMTYRPHPKSF